MLSGTRLIALKRWVTPAMGTAKPGQKAKTDDPSRKNAEH